MFNMNNKVYDYIKWGVIILLPAVAVLYGTLAKLYGLPCVNEVQGTIGAIQVFLGTILCISSAEYKGKEAVEKAIANIEFKKQEEPKVEPTPIEKPKEEKVEPIVEEPKEEVKEEPKAEPEEPKAEEPEEENSPFVVGKCYRIVAELGLNVRDGASKNARHKKREELTEDGKNHSADHEYATLLKGTLVSCVQTSGNWMLIPSGWICGIDDDGSVYLEEYTEPAGVQAIRNQLAKWTDPLHQGYDGMCEGWVHTVYWNAGLNYRGGYCCASANRDTNAENRQAQNGDLVFCSPNYHNIICGACGRHAGHVGIYMDGFVYGSQPQYKMTFDAWTSVWGYGGCTNMGNW